MILRKRKPCKGCGTLQFIFSGGYCKYCCEKAKPTKIKKVSEKNAEVIFQKREIKAELLNKNGKKCFFCEKKFENVDLVHIIRQSYSASLRSDPENCILGCRNCHTVFDDGGIEQRMQLKNIDKVLKKMELLDHKYYLRWTQL